MLTEREPEGYSGNDWGSLSARKWNLHWDGGSVNLRPANRPDASYSMPNIVRS